MPGSPIDVNQFPIDHLLLARDLDGNVVPGGAGSLVHEQPDLTRYHIGEVIGGRMDIVEGFASAAVDGPTMRAFEESVLREGGESFESQPDRQSEELTTVVRLGRTLVTHLGEPSIVGSGLAVPAGLPLVVRYGSAEETKAVFERKKQVVHWLAPPAVLFRTEIEVEWGRFARIPVRRPE